MHEQEDEASLVWHQALDTSGRILIPVELRRELEIEPGSQLIWTRGENGLELRTYQQSIDEIQDYFTSLSRSDKVWSDELIAERRREAARENGAG